MRNFDVKSLCCCCCWLLPLLLLLLAAAGCCYCKGAAGGIEDVRDPS